VRHYILLGGGEHVRCLGSVSSCACPTSPANLLLAFDQENLASGSRNRRYEVSNSIANLPKCDLISASTDKELSEMLILRAYKRSLHTTKAFKVLCDCHFTYLLQTHHDS
jgi:hypothetical protein